CKNCCVFVYVKEGASLVAFIGSAAFTPPGPRAFTPRSCIKTAINGLVPGGVNAALPTARRHLRDTPVEGPKVHRMPSPPHDRQRTTAISLRKAVFDAGFFPMFAP